ncbi:MAG: hypothetical protein WAX04_11935 [Oscillospiraceae bacterium]
MHRRAAVICTGAISRTESSKLFNDLGWDSLQTRRLIAKLVFFYKIKFKIAPNYLVTTLEAMRRKEVGRAVRSRAEFVVFCRGQLFYKSFFPSVLRIWSDLPDVLKSIDSLKGFKAAIKDNFCTRSSVLHNSYNYLFGSYTNILTQIRMGLSNLNDHLFRYNLSDNPFCPNCLSIIETTSHFLFECPKYFVIRVNLFISLQHTLAEKFVNDRKYLLEICFMGSCNFNLDLNRKVLSITRTFIRDSKRFT